MHKDALKLGDGSHSLAPHGIPRCTINSATHFASGKPTALVVGAAGAASTLAKAGLPMIIGKRRAAPLPLMLSFFRQ